MESDNDYGVGKQFLLFYQYRFNLLEGEDFVYDMSV